MKKKIKVLETIRQGKVGGGETHVLELCSNLDLTRFEPVVLSFTDGPMVDELRRRGIRTEVIYTESGFDFKVKAGVDAFIQREKFDIVHAHGTRAMSNVFASASKYRIPLMYTVHGWSFHPDQPFFIRKMREYSEWFLTSKATKTICVSKSNELDGIKRFGMKRSEVVYNAIDLEKFNPDKQFSDIRAELGIDANAPLIGFIVRITVQKDPLSMLRAIKLVAEKRKDVVLLMVGEGDLKQAAMDLATELGITRNVVFQPFRSDIPAILNAIDVYCLPSLWEGFPIGILEAMAMAKCVVATPVDGNPEVVFENQTGLFTETENPEILAEKLLQLINDSDLRATLAKNARTFVTQNFAIKPMVQHLEDIYSNLLK